MPNSDNHEAHDYAERIRERLPRNLQELREACGLSKYALWQKTGVSRDMIGRIEGGESIPTFHVRARLAYGVDKTLQEFVGNHVTSTSSNAACAMHGMLGILSP